MIAYANTKQLARIESEVGMPVEQFHTPATGYRPVDPSAHWAADNGAFARGGFDAHAFARMLTRLRPVRETCRFIAVPDVVGSAVCTREQFDEYRALFPQLVGWPLAFVAQNGCEGNIPWGRIACLFVGGVDPWKESAECEHVVRSAKIRGLWVHVGRLNTPERLMRFAELGADSFDGKCLTGLGRVGQRAALAEMWEGLQGGRRPAPLFRSDASLRLSA